MASNLSSEKQQETTEFLIGLIEGALARWYKGDPYRYLEMFDKENYAYFDPTINSRIDGYDAIKVHYDSIAGLVHCEDYTIEGIRVQLFDGSAVVSCNIIANNDPQILKWNSTEVFVLNSENEWRIVHSNWAFTRPMDVDFGDNKQLV